MASIIDFIENPLRTSIDPCQIQISWAITKASTFFLRKRIYARLPADGGGGTAVPQCREEVQEEVRQVEEGTLQLSVARGLAPDEGRQVEGDVADSVEDDASRRIMEHGVFAHTTSAHSVEVLKRL
jgi:hypothetical protein